MRGVTSDLDVSDAQLSACCAQSTFLLRHMNVKEGSPTECVDAQVNEATCAPLKHRPVLPAISDHTYESMLNGSLTRAGFSYW